MNNMRPINLKAFVVGFAVAFVAALIGVIANSFIVALIVWLGIVGLLAWLASD
jgi:hypothetical protein